MSRRQSFLAYLALLVGVTAFASSFARPTSGQQGSNLPPGVGRYHVAAGSSANYDQVFVTDSATGQTWSKDIRSGRAKWIDHGSPIQAK